MTCRDKPITTVAFLGAGNMAEALVKGVLNAGLFVPSQIRVTDVSAARLALFADTYRVGASSDNRGAVAGADVVVLAVKPQVLPELLKEVRDSIPAGALVISIAAGIPLSAIEQGLKPGSRVVRVMPNTPALVGAGAAAFCLGHQASESDAVLVTSLFQAVGLVVRLEESMMDAVTAVSGSGPAYVFYLAEIMLRAARDLGLPDTAARSLVAQTLLGAARMLTETGVAPDELRRRVTSKGGTTAAAIEVLDAGQVRETWEKALHAACRRSKELAR